MRKQPLPRSQLRQAILKCVVISSASLALTIGSGPLMADVISADDPIFTQPPKVCDYIYGVNDYGVSDSQIFRIDPRNGYQIEPLGPLYPGLDIEAIDVSQYGEIYAAAGDNSTDTTKAGHLYQVDPVYGNIIDMGDTGFAEIDGLSFNPSTGELWGWAQDAGLIKFTYPITPLATLFIKREGEMEDLTWNNDGTVLYAIENLHSGPNMITAADIPYTTTGSSKIPLPEPPDDNWKHELYAYDVSANTLNVICQSEVDSLGEIEGLEMAEDGTLVLGYNGSNNKPILAALNTATCELTPLAISPSYNTAVLLDSDIEALGVCAPCLVEPPSTEWMYAQDSFHDTTGYPKLEIFGMAMKQEGNTLIVAFNAGMPPSGWDVPADLVGPNKVRDGNVAFSDFVMDFHGKKYAVRFSPNNDSSLPPGEVGLYSHVVLKDVTKENWGHPRLDTYVQAIGDEATMADLTFPMTYFDMMGYRSLPMSIESGIKVEDANYQALDATQLQAMGLNFPAEFKVQANQLGKYTFGFSFNKPADMIGRFLGYVFDECGNDGIAIVGELPECLPPPENVR